MDLPWNVIGVISSLIVLTILLALNVPKLVKYLLSPRIDVFLHTYPKDLVKQEGVLQFSDERQYKEELRVLPNSSPEIAMAISPKWSYEIKIIEVLGHLKSKITPAYLFAKDISDPTLIDVKIEPPIKDGEERKLTLRISTRESRKLFVKELRIKGSTQ